MQEPHASPDESRLQLARVLVEVGELLDAEVETARVLEERPQDVDALDLLAKIKHIRGELTEAIACWSRVRELAQQPRSGLLRLSSLLQAARQSEAGPGGFVVVGPFQSWRKPVVHLDLEQAFRLFLAGRLEEAESLCERLGARHRGRDADVVKLAVLARAWMRELSGDLDGARRLLEGLGRERGFETDTDRVLALARVYERIGTPDLLERAVLVYEHLDRGSDKISIRGHLAVLLRRLDRHPEAEAHGARFHELFRRRMHRVSPEEALDVAAEHYVPLPRLSRVGRPAVLAPREGRLRALGLALRGDLPAARRILEARRGVLDLKYRADVAALEEDPRAAALYLAAWEQDPEDPRVLGWLLDRAPGEAAVRQRLQEPAVADRAAQVLEAALRANPLRAATWRRLACLRGLTGDAEQARRCAERAQASAEAWQRRHFPVGRALAAAVYHFAGKAHGLIHEVWATRRPVEAGRGGYLDEILGNLAPEMVQGVRNTFLSVREYARARWPHRTRDILDYAYAFKVTKDDETSGGLSAGLPSALALLSVFLDRPVPQSMAASGVLVADAHDVLAVRAVGEPAYKVRGAYNRNLAMLVLPAENRRELESSPLVPPEACEQIVRYAASLDEAVGLAWGPDARTE